MRELSIQETEKVTGGVAPVVLFAAGVIARSVVGSAVKSAVKMAVQGFIAGGVGAALRHKSFTD